jgi:hypothetical protein
MTDYNATIDAKGKIATPGVDWGNPLILVERHGLYAVVLVRGHQRWAGIGSQAYSQTKYLLVKLVPRPRPDDPEPGRQWFKMVIVREEAPGRDWKKIREELVQEARKLADKESR